MRTELKMDSKVAQVSCFTDEGDKIYSHNLPTFNDVTIAVQEQDGSKKVVLFLSLGQAVIVRDALIESIRQAKTRAKEQKKAA